MPTLTVNGRKLEVPKGLTKEQTDEIVEDYVSRQAQKPASHEEFTHDFNTGNMVGNIPSSGYKAGADAANFVKQVATQPVQTAKGINEVMESLQLKGANLFGTPESQRAGFLKNVNEDKADQVVGFIDDRYGSIDKFQYTLENDPVGVISDLAGLLSTAGLAKDLSNIAGGAGMKALTSEASALSKAGAAIDPFNLAVNVAGSGVGASINAAKKATGTYLPASIYESAAKMPVVGKDRDRKVQTALDNEINVTHTSSELLQSKIDAFNSEIDQLIKASVDSGRTIPINQLFQSLSSLKNKAGDMNLDAVSDMKIIDRISNDFQQHLKSLGKKHLTAAELQSLKVNAYSRIKHEVTNNTSSQAANNARKAFAFDAKKAIEQLEPKTQQVNKKLSDLYDLQNTQLSTAKRVGNKNTVSLQDGVILGSSGISSIAANIDPIVAATVGATLVVLGKDKVQGITAINLHKLAQKPAFQRFMENNPNVSKARLAAIIGGREDFSESN